VRLRSGIGSRGGKISEETHEKGPKTLFTSEDNRPVKKRRRSNTCVKGAQVGGNPMF